MQLRHGIDYEDWHKVTMHGKDIADNDGSGVSGMVKKSFNGDYGKRTQARTLFSTWHIIILNQIPITIHVILERVEDCMQQ